MNKKMFSILENVIIMNNILIYLVHNVIRNLISGSKINVTVISHLVRPCISLCIILSGIPVLCTNKDYYHYHVNK